MLSYFFQDLFRGLRLSPRALGDQATPSSRRKCPRPDISLPMIVRPSGAMAKREMGPSAVKPALYSPLCKFQTRSVPSAEAEIARYPSGVTAKQVTRPVWPCSIHSD